MVAVSEELHSRSSSSSAMRAFGLEMISTATLMAFHWLAIHADRIAAATLAATFALAFASATLPEECDLIFFGKARQKCSDTLS